jgi:hypothetical protein
MIFKLFQARLETTDAFGARVRHVAFINLDSPEVVFEAGENYPDVVGGTQVKSIFLTWVERIVRDAFSVAGDPSSLTLQNFFLAYDSLSEGTSLTKTELVARFSIGPPAEVVDILKYMIQYLYTRNPNTTPFSLRPDSAVKQVRPEHFTRDNGIVL